ncbi:MAG: hypothetical protein QOG16_344 [Actinomycetota bacterium]|jgi:uncharacterized protein YndB with AHSA1/START domain|nr:hypothetical protein [Actinomycetota bacterium]
MTTMTSKGSAKLTFPSETQIVITREFAAPKHLVYRAATEPELVKRWWHANRGEVILAEIDLRVGGKWRYVSKTPEGFEVAFHGEYRQIVENERVVTTEAYEGAPDPDDNATVNTMTLSEEGGTTTMTVTIDCPNEFVRNAIIESGMEAGMQDAYDLLEELAVSLS